MLDQLQPELLCDPGLENPCPLADETVIESGRPALERESLFVECTDEIDAWARHALALNGFGDFL